MNTFCSLLVSVYRPSRSRNTFAINIARCMCAELPLIESIEEKSTNPIKCAVASVQLAARTRLCRSNRTQTEFNLPRKVSGLIQSPDDWPCLVSIAAATNWILGKRKFRMTNFANRLNIRGCESRALIVAAIRRRCLRAAVLLCGLCAFTHKTSQKPRQRKSSEKSRVLRGSS